MVNAVNNGVLFLISVMFDLYVFLLIVRMILVWAGANYFDPFTQFIVKLTDPVVKPLRRLIPNIARLETSSLILILLLSIIKFLIIFSINTGFPNVIGVIILAAGDIIRGVLQIFFYAVILQAILSWIQPYAPVNRLLSQVTAPIMQPFRRIIPLINGMDITPIPVLISLQLLIIMIAAPIMQFGSLLAAS